jgi:hypothetical protein
MEFTREIKFDFDSSISAEDRFIIRRRLNSFIINVNASDFKKAFDFLDKTLVVSGFTFYAMLKEEYQLSIEKRFGLNKNLLQSREMVIPKIKLFKQVSSKFYLKGDYEEYENKILVAEGGLELEIVKKTDNFIITRINFFPRLLAADIWGDNDGDGGDDTNNDYKNGE